MKVSSVISRVGARVFSVPKPVAVGFEVTHRCNLACAYCDRHARLPDEMSLTQILAALAGLKALGMRELTLDGGEALLHPRIDEVVAWLGDRQIEMRLNTNGVLLPKKLKLIPSLAKINISLDGPAELHDQARGPRAFERAVTGARVALDLGTPVEFTCSLGRHNFEAVDELLDIAEALGAGVIFQPMRDSLLLGVHGPGSSFRLDEERLHAALARVEERKRGGGAVLNGWSSLRHFRNFPEEMALPCAAGWINVTLDPQGNLFHCGQLSRRSDAPNVVRLGVAEAFRQLERRGCGQCWCARVVEENYTWGGRVVESLPPAPLPHAARQ